MTKLTLILYCAFIVTTVIGCSSETKGIPVNELPTIMPIVETPMIQEAVYDENYMADCRREFPVVYNEQADFKGLYAGKSTPIEDELFVLFGKPLESFEYKQELQYLYFDQLERIYTRIFVRDNLISRMSIEPADLNWFSVVEILEKYGCPDLVYASMVSPDDPQGTEALYTTYTVTTLLYGKAGLRFVFSQFPISYSQSPNIMVYEFPKTPKALMIEMIPKVAEGEQNNMLVNFLDAIK